MGPTVSLVRGTCWEARLSGGKELCAWGVVCWLRTVDVLWRAEGECGAAIVPGMSRSDVGIRKGFIWFHVDDRSEAGGRRGQADGNITMPRFVECIPERLVCVCVCV